MPSRAKPKGALTHERKYLRVGGKSMEPFLDPDVIKTWSDEELLRGQRKDRNGRFTGRPPKVIPDTLHREYIRRQMRGALQLMSQNLEKACEVLVSIIDDPKADNKDKIRAAQLIIERVMGKSVEQIDVKIEAKPAFLQAIQDGIVPGDDEIIDAEVIEESVSDVDDEIIDDIEWEEQEAS